jgi:hypothetical protein
MTCEKYRMRVFDNRVVRKIVGHKRKQAGQNYIMRSFIMVGLA